MAVVGRMAVAVVDVVDVVSVGDGDVTAARTVLVLVVLVDDVTLGLALVPVTVVLAVQVTVMDVVDVVSVGNSDVATVGAVLVLVVLMGLVSHACLLRVEVAFAIPGPTLCIFNKFSIVAFVQHTAGNESHWR